MKKTIASPKVKIFKLTQLKMADYNPRVIDEVNLAGLAESIQQFGYIELIVVNTFKNKNVIISGHQRLKVLQAMDIEECLCITVNFDPKKEKVCNLAMNNPEIQGKFIEEIGDYISKLQEELGEDSDLLLKLRINELKSQIVEEKVGKILDDDIPKPPKKIITKPGDIWILGEHRLMCGDSTNPEHLKKLMNGQLASLFATDPPYCVDYTGKDRPKGCGKDWTDVYHEVDIVDSKKFMTAFYKNAFEYLKPNTAMYLWHASRKLPEINEVCNELGILNHQQIIWVKPCVVLTYSVYSWRHEPCLLLWRKGQRPFYDVKQKSLSSVWPLSYIRSGDPNKPEYYTDVWELDYDGKNHPSTKIEHPTVKPVECFAIPMRVHTKPGDICLETFSGGGTQIIAAEKLSRRCFAMEVEPFFVDVAVRRWEAWTGKKAKLLKNETPIVKKISRKVKKGRRK